MTTEIKTHICLGCDAEITEEKIAKNVLGPNGVPRVYCTTCRRKEDAPCDVGEYYPEYEPIWGRDDVYSY